MNRQAETAQQGCAFLLYERGMSSPPMVCVILMHHTPAFSRQFLRGERALASGQLGVVGFAGLLQALLGKQYAPKGGLRSAEIAAPLGCGGCYSRLIEGVYSGATIVR